jgi:uncharacterized 2Fe-2S/4Fe-4S cluster protein (DUF4445 family)
MNSYKLTIVPTGEIYPIAGNANLLDVIRRQAISLESPCIGKGTCGKCKVQIIAGQVNSPTVEEVAHLSEQELEQGIRLSCRVEVLGDLEVRLLEKEQKSHRILATGYVPEAVLDPVINKKVISLTDPGLGENIAYLDIIASQLNDNLDGLSSKSLRKIAEILNSERTMTAVYNLNTVIGFEAGDTSGESFAVAIDIGTTTVVASLVDLNSGLELGSETALNPQTQYGLDVLSRIEYAEKTPEGQTLLQTVILDCLNGLIAGLCRRFKIAVKRIYEVTVAANTTMQHLLLGVDPKGIGQAPYIPVFKNEQYFPATELGLNVSPFAHVYCLPGVSSYIGSDIVAGVLVAEIYNSPKNILFIDIGTNGEMVLVKNGKLSACSCAAGPALEGMNISCGMRASEGAVEGVRINENEIDLKIIDNALPKGLCGSGIMEAVSEIVRIQLVESSGRLKTREKLTQESKEQFAGLLAQDTGKKRVILYSENQVEVAISQSDIRQVQLAKGAILSGFYALLRHMDLEIGDLDEVIIAGAFGAHLKVESLIGVGLIPAELEQKVRYIGNSAKTGAFLSLVSQDVRSKLEQIAREIDYFELSVEPGYEKLFTRCLSFSKLN